ncbi:MAG: hypothetical protein LBI94_00155 [Treponema sp.]|jgi:hypothetical protein|nr:hypothetical protein [Treponema sp.]
MNLNTANIPVIFPARQIDQKKIFGLISHLETVQESLKDRRIAAADGDYVIQDLAKNTIEKNGGMGLRPGGKPAAEAR